MKNEQNLSSGTQVWRLHSESSLRGSGRTQKHPFQRKKIIMCTISESWRGNGFKTSKALQIVINTLNYPASLKAFTLLLFPAKKQAPDCGCLEWNIQEGVQPAGQEMGEGARERLRCPGTLGPAGWRETERAIVQPVLARSACMCLRLAGAGGFLRSWGLFPLPVEMGREKCQSCNGFPGLLCVLTGKPLY